MRIEEIIDKPVDCVTRIPSDLLVSDGLIGIEIEVSNLHPKVWEDCHTNKKLKYWELKEDGSVRGGGEFVFKSPLSGRDLVDALHEIEAYLTKQYKENGIRTTNDYQTSVHVHLDVRDTTTEQLYHLCILYSLFEPLLFKYCGDNRQRNIFCLSVNHAPASFIKLIERLSLRDLERADIIYHVTTGSTEYSRYSACNFNALNRFGSVEFRGHRGTYDSDHLLNWVNILLSLKKYILEYQFDNNLLERISHSSFRKMATQIFGRDLVEKMWLDLNGDLEEELWNSLRFTQRLIHMREVVEESDKYKDSSLAKDFKEDYTETPIYKYLKKQDALNDHLEDFIKSTLSKYQQKKRKEEKVKKKRLIPGTRSFRNTPRGLRAETQRQEALQIPSIEAAVPSIEEVVNETTRSISGDDIIRDDILAEALTILAREEDNS